MQLVSQSVIILLSFGLVYFWGKTSLSGYTVQIIGFLVFLYILISARKKSFTTFSESWMIFALNTIILLLIISTGGFSSPLYFLLYFLAFGIAFVFKPSIVFIFTFSAVLFFFENALKDDIMKNMLMIGSLILVSPLVFFFGKGYQAEEAQEKKIKKMEQSAVKIEKDAMDILEEDNLNSRERERLSEIRKEAKNLTR